MSVCKGCAYNLGDECQILNNKQITKCFAKADFNEVKRREKDIENYKKRFEVDVFSKKTVREKLDEKFLELYEDGYTDMQIAKKLDISPSSVGNRRKDLGLEIQRKKAHGNGQIKNNSQVQSNINRRKVQ